MADGEWRRTVPCKDGIGRDRAIQASLTEDGRLVLGVPAGEAAYLDLGDAGDQLKRCVDEARVAAAEILMGRRPSTPPLTGLLQHASTFYVLDRESRQQRLGVGLNGTLIAVNGPGFWQVDTGTVVTVTNKMSALAQLLRQRS